MYFDDIYVYSNQGTDVDVNGCSYAFGHRAVDNCELISVYVFGMNYGAEWSGNLNMGSETDCNGDHLGFNLAAGKVYAALKDYIAKNLAGKDLKVWICGYSRGGGISDALAFRIIENKEVEIEQKDMFVYTFEAPVSISTQRVQAYTCIHNIVVEADIVPHLIPKSYGITRPGHDYVLDADPDYADACLHSIIGEDANMPTFTASADYGTPAEFLAYLITELQVQSPEEAEDYYAKVPGFESRERYVSSVQDRASYLLEVLMKDDQAALGSLMDYVSENKTVVIAWLGYPDGFYEGVPEAGLYGLKQILDGCGTQYDDEKLKVSCYIAYGIPKNEGLMDLLNSFLGGGVLDNAKYTVTCHYPGVIYSLLQCYDPD